MQYIILSLYVCIYICIRDIWIYLYYCNYTYKMIHKDIDNIIAELLAARRVPKMTLAPLEKAAPRPSTRAQRKAQKGPGLAAG